MAKVNLEALNPETHKDIKINTADYSDPMYKVNACYLVASELMSVVHDYPVYVVKNPEKNQFQLNAILGFDSGENLYLKEGKWVATYFPLDIQRRPFQLYLPEGVSSPEGQIALNRNSEQVQGTYGHSVFDDDGQPTVYLQRIKLCFSQLLSGAAATAQALQKMADYDLIHQVDLNITLRDGTESPIRGVYSVNHEALQALSGERLEECNRNGIIQLCYLMDSSVVHMDKLISWKSDVIVVKQ